MIPVKCDYCGRVEMTEASNCVACGGALPQPEVRETVTERSVRITADMLDVTCMSDTKRRFIAGPKDTVLHETVVTRERIK